MAPKQSQAPPPPAQQGPPPPFTSVSLLGSEARAKAIDAEKRTKLVIRHIPPKLTEEQFAEATARWASQIKWRRYEPGQAAASKSDIATLATAYLEFAHTAAAIDFSRAVDGAPVTDSDGTTCRVQVEFALCQKVPEASPAKVDARAGTIDDDDEYKDFVEGLGAEREKMPSAQVWLEEREAKRKAAEKARGGKAEVVVPPLLEALNRKHRSANLKRDKKARERELKLLREKQAKLLAQREARLAQKALLEQQQKGMTRKEKKAAAAAPPPPEGSARWPRRRRRARRRRRRRAPRRCAAAAGAAAARAAAPADRATSSSWARTTSRPSTRWCRWGLGGRWPAGVKANPSRSADAVVQWLVENEARRRGRRRRRQPNPPPKKKGGKGGRGGAAAERRRRRRWRRRRRRRRWRRRRQPGFSDEAGDGGGRGRGGGRGGGKKGGGKGRGRGGPAASES